MLVDSLRDEYKNRFAWRSYAPILKAEVQSVAKYDPSQPRGAKGTSVGGRWVKERGSSNEYWTGEGTPRIVEGRRFTSEEGYQWHEQGPVAEWAKNLPYKDVQEIDNYSGFGYGDVNKLRRGTYTPPTISHFVRPATEEEYDATKIAYTEEYFRLYPHPLGREPYQRTPDDPDGRVLDAEGQYVGHMVKNQFYVNPATGEKVFISVQRPGPDLKRLAEVQQHADALDDLIANRGYVLPEDITVERGAYLPGVTFEQLQDMQYPGPNGEDPAIYTEEGFTSTMVGDAKGRADSYPALGKWESIHHRFPNEKNSLVNHQDEVGTAVRFHITLPAGTKVASVESARRLEHEFPRIPNPEPMGQKELENPFWQQHPELWTVRDYTGTPTVDASDLDKGKEGRRTESEVLIGSGAKFAVTHVKWGNTYNTGDGSLKPVPVAEVYLEYIGGGSSDGRH